MSCRLPQTASSTLFTFVRLCRQLNHVLFRDKALPRRALVSTLHKIPCKSLIPGSFGMMFLNWEKSLRITCQQAEGSLYSAADPF